MKLSEQQKKDVLLFARLVREMLERQGRTIQLLRKFFRHDYQKYRKAQKDLDKKRPPEADAW